jgi:hypothetical protein
MRPAIGFLREGRLETPRDGLVGCGTRVARDARIEEPRAWPAAPSRLIQPAPRDRPLRETCDEHQTSAVPERVMEAASRAPTTEA